MATDKAWAPGDVDKLVHDPVRLGILHILSSVTSADFTYLATALGVTRGNLSTHLTKLADAGLLTQEKTGKGRSANTELSITVAGRERLDEHWKQLDQLRESRPRQNSK